MPSDAHAHPFDLLSLDPDAENERRRLGIRCAASSWHENEFLFQERLSLEARAAGGPAVALCFGAHPQLARGQAEEALKAAELLKRFAAQGRIAAVGEIGFDLFDAEFRKTAEFQERLFVQQLAIAERFSLPCVLHVRKAMHLVFAHSRKLASLKAVVFHSYSGTAREAIDLLKRGMNAYFSFGTTVFLNHKKAMEACSVIPSDRLLIETDAPYQAPRGKSRSTWSDLFLVAAAAAKLRAQAGMDCTRTDEVLEATDRNFARVFLD